MSTEIQRVDNSVILKLPQQHQKFAILRNGVGVSAIDTDVAYRACFKCIKGVHALKKQTDVSTDDLAAMAKEFVNGLTKFYPNITLMEISTAMENGVHGFYGEYFGLNNVTYISWVKSFLADEKRKEALIELEKLRNAKDEPTEKEKAEIAEIAIETMISEYRKTGKVWNKANVNFLHLWKTGKIRYGEAQKQKYRQQAEANLNKEYTEQLEQAKGNNNRDEVKKIELELDKLINGDSETLVRIEMGNLAIIDFINTLQP